MPMSNLFRILPPLAVLTMVACSSSGSGEPAPPATPEGGPEVEVDAGPAPIEWKRCNLHSEGDPPAAECARIPVPLDAKNPGGKTIDFFVKRYRREGGKGLRALWLLQGGPGASGYVYEEFADQLSKEFPDIDFYIPDHRGTGKSSRLGCPVQETPESEAGLAITKAEWGTCLPQLIATHGDDLRFYDTTNAANDLGVAIGRINTDARPTIVLGVSYGTYWAHRYLQLFPKQASGVVLDSIVTPGGSLARQDADSDEAAHDLMDACKANAYCLDKLGPDPWARAQALFAKLKTGHCPAIAAPGIATNVLFRNTFAGFLMDPRFRAFIPAIVYRLDRCAPNDEAALKKLVAVLTQEQPESEMLKQWGWGLTYNIIFSELWESPPPSIAELAAIRDRAVASRDITEQMGALYDGWPRYTPDPISLAYADTDTPMLMLQGGLDPATLLRKARPMREHFTRPNQTWVEVPSASHTVFGSSMTTKGRNCGLGMVMAFVKDPKAKVDTSCVADVPALDFQTPSTSYATALFGTSDAWE
jgi:pimeloyl-ACP methyl ester carboxylesterase